jgi:hypothetical protein
METSISISEKERNSIVEKIASDPRFSHGVFGRFNFGNYPGGHVLQEEKRGPSNFSQNVFKYEDIYDTAFKKHTGGIEFRARIVSTPIENEEHLFTLTFNDRQEDKRPGSHTDYFFIVPESQADEMTEVISVDPEILIKVFQKVFPHYDRSGGKLTIDPENPKIIIQ